VAALFLVGVFFWVTSDGGAKRDRVALRSKAATGRLARFVGDQACRECHPGETALHSRSGHSHTLRPAAKTELAQRLNGQRVPDPEQPGVSWSYALRGGQFLVQRSSGNQTKQLVIDYAFGSGHHATTFFSLTDPDPDHIVGLEHRLTYFSATGTLGITPGQKASDHEGDLTPMGARNPLLDAVHCFGCHTSTTSARDPNVLDAATMIPNISCERCHGLARGHVEAARRGEQNLTMDFGPGRATADQQMRLCGQCHRYPDILPGSDVFQVQPSEIRPDNPKIGRFQPVGLMQSACYTKSRGALSCVTCHDPHDRSSKDRAMYEAACVSCHHAPSSTACPVSPGAGCLECHMPAHDAGQGVLFTDHWIRVRKND